MEVVLDSIDHFLILVSKNGHIMQTNLNFKNIFKRELPTNIKDFLDAKLVEKNVISREEIRFKEVKNR